MRFFVICVACWFAAFAIMHIIQMAVVTVPADLQPSFTLAWTMAASAYAPVAAWIIARSRSQPK